MWELNHKEVWRLMNWCFQIVVLEKTLESLLDCKDIQPVHPKGDQSWVFIRRTHAEGEYPILWPPDAKSRFIIKDPAAGEVWKHEDKWMTEDEMALQTQWTWVWASCRTLLKTQKPGVLQSHGFAESRTRLSDWTTTVHEAHESSAFCAY